MFEQSGLYRIDLYENINVNISYDATGKVASIVNSGRFLSLNDNDNYLLNYQDEQTIGRNNKIIHTYSLPFYIFNFDNFDLLSEIGSHWGWIPVLYFRNESKQVIPSPVFLIEETEYIENQTQVYPVTLRTQTPTFKNIIPFAEIPAVWILADGNWRDSGIWIDTEIWNDN